MDDDVLCSDAEVSLRYIHSKFDSYTAILDRDQQACDDLIASIRDESELESNMDFERVNQLNYFEQEALKTYEENKTCLFQMFQNLFQLHRELPFRQILLHERQIAQSFQYRPQLLPNIEKLRCVTSLSDPTHPMRLTTPASTVSLSAPGTSIGLNNRAEIDAFHQVNESAAFVRPTIESNEIDLTQLIRDTYSSHGSATFKFSDVSKIHHRKPIPPTKNPLIRPLQRTIVCQNSLLLAANKRYALLHNMNIVDLLYSFDTQEDESKELPWDEGAILSLGHVDSNLFYLITPTKIFLYDLIKEQVQKQYFLYETLYKDFCLITTDLSHRTSLKCSNQIQSFVDDDYCYYLYMNKDYQQMLIKCSLEDFHTECQWNLTEKFPSIDAFLGFTVTNQLLITLLVRESKRFQLLFCDESPQCQQLKKRPINHAIDPSRIVSMAMSNLKRSSSIMQKHSTMKFNQFIWLILDSKAHCIHCLTFDHVQKQIDLSTKPPMESIALFGQQLFLAANQFDVQIIDLDQYLSS